MKQQIKDFAEETAESLYGINLKDWASQLGDACMRHGRKARMVPKLSKIRLPTLWVML